MSHDWMGKVKGEIFQPPECMWLSMTMQTELNIKLTSQDHYGKANYEFRWYWYFSSRIQKFQLQPTMRSKVIICRLTPHFWACIKTARRDAPKDNFQLHCWLELQLPDPFTHIEHKRIHKSQLKPIVRSKVILCCLTPHFWASDTTARPQLLPKKEAGDKFVVSYNTSRHIFLPMVQTMVLFVP
jgi:hypothetical protein